MSRKYEFALKAGALAGAFALILTTAGCGAPGYCGSGSFPTFVDEEWRTYCDDFTDHLDNAGDHSLLEVTRFLDAHPDKAAELRASLAKYESPDRCFASKREQLDYRALNSCLQHDEDQRIQMINSWKARAEPWLEEHEARTQNVQPKLGDLMRESGRLLREVNEAFDFHVESDPTEFLEWRDKLNAEAESVEKSEAISDEWRVLLQSVESEYLKSAMIADFGPQVAEITDNVLEQQERLDELRLIEAYLERAVVATGRPCPAGISASSELRTARKTLTKQIAMVQGSKPRVIAKKTPDTRPEAEFEFFDGFVCGERPEEKQLKDNPRLCSIFAYRLERKRPKDSKKWGDWYVKKFIEGGAKDSVDCALKK